MLIAGWLLGAIAAASLTYAISETTQHYHEATHPFVLIFYIIAIVCGGLGAYLVLAS